MQTLNMYTSDDDQRWHEVLEMICHSSARHILDGISFSEFRAHMLGMIEFLLNTIATPAAMRTPEMQQSMATLTALQIWNVTPIPENRFRPRKITRPERNAPCLCGSGRKFKQCCAAVDPPDLGVTEVHMLGKVLEQFPRRQLASLPLQALDPEALALVAEDWLGNGQDKDAIALLENLFSHLAKLDARAEVAADLLLGCYLNAPAPRKKQKFIDALKTAPDKTLASTGWQRQTTVCSDRDDYAGAWAAFREAQRLTPNAPALSHLEILVLVSEGRREEARARAKFWSAKLARDSKYDHSALIALLHDLADDSDAGRLRSLAATHDPLAEVIQHWPAPACAYTLAHEVELAPHQKLADCESRWMKMRGGLLDQDKWLTFLQQEPLAGQSFRLLRDSVEMLGMLPEMLPGSNAALTRQLLERGEKLRQTVLDKLQAFDKELAWGFIDNRPLLTLVSYYCEEFATIRPAETLDLLRWSVNIANPTDNIGLREKLIHALVGAGQADEAIAVATRYPDDFAFTEFGHVLALFAAGRLAEAEAALQSAGLKSPKIWKMLHSAKPKAPRPNTQGMTTGSDDEAFEYVVRHLALWRSSGALQWSAGIKIPSKSAAKVKELLAATDQPDLFS